MTISGQDSRDWEEKLGAWIGARWRWLFVAVLLLFALNNLVGLVVGSLGLIASRVIDRILTHLRRARAGWWPWPCLIPQL